MILFVLNLRYVYALSENGMQASELQHEVANGVRKVLLINPLKVLLHAERVG